jgi:hypothetical protein
MNILLPCQDRSLSVRFGTFPPFMNALHLSHLLCLFSFSTFYFMSSLSKDTNAFPIKFLFVAKNSFSVFLISFSTFSIFSSISLTFFE